MPKPGTPYELGKSVWTDAGFERMCWHDNQIWAVGHNDDHSELIIDLDYIFEWVD